MAGTLSLEFFKTLINKLKEEALVLWFARSHVDTPKLAKLLCYIAVAYAMSPIDVIPDFIPVIGRLDDLFFLPVVLWAARNMLPANVVADCRKQGEDFLNDKGSFPISIGGVLTGLTGWSTAIWYAVQNYAPELLAKLPELLALLKNLV